MKRFNDKKKKYPDNYVKIDITAKKNKFSILYEAWMFSRTHLRFWIILCHFSYHCVSLLMLSVI